MVAYVRYGRQIIRRLAKEYLRLNTDKWLKSKMVFALFGALWKTLSPEIRTMWEGWWAPQQGCPSLVEKNEVVCYRYCPIPHYPPRPRVLSGFNAFVAACVQAYIYGFTGIRLKEPGIKVPAPPPDVDVIGYDPKTGELEVQFVTPDIFSPEKCDQARIVIWVNLQSEGEYLAMRHLLTSLDCPLKGTVIKHKFKVIETQTKKLNYAKEIKLARLRYFYLDIGAQIAATYGADRACCVSAGFWQHALFLNDPRLIEIADLVKMGAFRDIGKIKFNARFHKTVRRLRRLFPQPAWEELINMCFVTLKDTTLKKFQQRFVTIRPDKK